MPNREDAALHGNWRRWQQGDPDAGREALEQIGRRLEAESARAAAAPAIEAARQQAEQRAQAAIWGQHASSFGVAPDDKEVRAAADFKALNAQLLRKAKDQAVLDAAWENPAVQRRVQREIAKATGTDTDAAETAVERRFMEHPDDPAALEAHRQLRRRRGLR